MKATSLDEAGMNAQPGGSPHGSDDALMAGRTGRPNLNVKGHPLLALLFGVLVVAGLGYALRSLVVDIRHAGPDTVPILVYVLLGVALFIALGFEFVNGFHDTANAVATVIYTHSLRPQFAVIWSGTFNFLGVLLSSGSVAYGVITLLPVELILQVGSSAGFAMVFALLLAAIIWNLGTWWFGLPASSSHTLIGSIIGVGIMNALVHGRHGSAGVDWGQVSKVGYALLLSPIAGFLLAAVMMLVLRRFVRDRTLYAAPESEDPPPWWIRMLLVLTCTGVSFAHGSNDGQKGMGLIMLILVGTVPMAYALNRAMPDSQVEQFGALAVVTQKALVDAQPRDAADRTPTLPAADQARQRVSTYLREHTYDPAVALSVASLMGAVGDEVRAVSSLASVPTSHAGNVRNDMYLTAEAIRHLQKDPAAELTDDARTKMQAFRVMLDDATRFIPLWVKVAVAVALGLGTMVGWKRIVVTVGEKIGKTHLSYAQGLSAEVVAMATIGAADGFGLPVSTTHVLSSGVAGTMVANGSGLQWKTVRNLALAWVLTLPVAVCLSAAIYWLLLKVA